MPKRAVPKRVVIVGASLAGLRAAESLRRAGHDGTLTIVGAEVHRPYDRPPLSKQILTGKAEAKDVALPADAALDAEWLLGTAATGLDLDRRRVRLDGGEDLPFDQAGAGHGRPAPTGSTTCRKGRECTTCGPSTTPSASGTTWQRRSGWSS